MEKYRIVADFSCNWEYWLDPDGNMIYVSPSCERITGYKAAEFMADSKLAEKIVHSEDRDMVSRHFHEGKGKSDEHALDFRIITRSGEVRWISHVCRPVFSGSGEWLGRRGSNRENTDQKNMEQQLRVFGEEMEWQNWRLGAAYDDLERRNKDLDEFTYVASHDLQEPLRKLMAFSDLLKKDLGGNLPERAENDLNFIADAAGRMQILVQDLLALSRAGRAAMSRENLSLDVCVDSALDALSLLIKETGAEIVRDELPEVWGGRTLLTQLYQNLIGNALKFNDNDRPKIRLTFQSEDGCSVFGVKDNGIGIKPEYAEQVFAPFKRLHGRAEYKGTGIGLAICRKIIERHDGRIWVESEPGRGAHFKFEIGEREEER